MGILSTEKKESNGVIVEHMLHESSNILKTSYNYNTRQLVITFKNGGVYNYNAVPHNIYENIKSSPSSGKYISSEIIRKYTTVKVGSIAGTTGLSQLVESVENLKGKL